MKDPANRPSSTPVRMPTELRDWLKHQSIDNRRTLGNEIVFRLQESRERQLAASNRHKEYSHEQHRPVRL
jgi:hypothetical protein